MPIPCLPTYSSLCPMWEGPTGGPLPGLGNSPLQPGSRERCKGSDWYPSIRWQGGVSSLAALSYQVPTPSFLPSCYQPLGPGVLILGPTPRSGDGSGLTLGLKEQHPVACSPSGPQLYLYPVAVLSFSQPWEAYLKISANPSSSQALPDSS